MSEIYKQDENQINRETVVDCDPPVTAEELDTLFADESCCEVNALHTWLPSDDDFDGYMLSEDDFDALFELEEDEPRLEDESCS